MHCETLLVNNPIFTCIGIEFKFPFLFISYMIASCVRRLREEQDFFFKILIHFQR